MVSSPGAALTPLRLFLGGTFVYAGIQKLSDPGYLHPGAPTYIGTQLRGFAHGTPGGFLLRTFAIPHPKLAGTAVALIEIAIGLLALLGLLTQIAAAGGLGLNLVLFLTNSWHTSPYFLGSDIVFVFAWLPFVLTGATGQPALDHAVERWTIGSPPWSRAWRRFAGAWEADVSRVHGGPRRRPSASEAAVTRRRAIAQAAGLTGLGALAIGGISALVKGSYRPAAASLSGSGSRPPSRSAAAKPAPATHHPARRSASLPPGATRLGPSSRLPAGQAATYTDPSTRQADILIRDSSGKVRAFSAVCTHAGCQVGYQGGQIVCPCHGGVFSAETGAVQSGPPPQGLAPRRVVEQGGSIYAVPD
ncbi:MAG: thiosulfate dehydrogenase (quinone) large subunit [Thermoleophilaceae bacterium]|nr:thiosulfate dehydrogenase (quinone) large subunit [Thermoleophilaceae bacterium]